MASLCKGKEKKKNCKLDYRFHRYSFVQLSVTWVVRVQNLQWKTVNELCQKTTKKTKQKSTCISAFCKTADATHDMRN